MKADEAEEVEEEARTVALEENISSHIFSTSATMVGVCLTAMGLFRLVNELRKVNGIADNLLALDALASCSRACCLMSRCARAAPSALGRGRSSRTSSSWPR